MKVQDSCIKELLLASYKVNNEIATKLDEINFDYFLSNQQWKYKEVVSNNFFLLLIKSTMNVRGACVKKIFLLVVKSTKKVERNCIK